MIDANIYFLVGLNFAQFISIIIVLRKMRACNKRYDDMIRYHVDNCLDSKRFDSDAWSEANLDKILDKLRKRGDG